MKHAHIYCSDFYAQRAEEYFEEPYIETFVENFSEIVDKSILNYLEERMIRLANN